MNNLVNRQKCLVMRSGVQIWVDEEKINKLIGAMESGNAPKFMLIDGEFINSVDIVGVFTPERMQEFTNLKKGMWKCDEGIWHNRNDECTCRQDRIKREYEDARKQTQAITHRQMTDEERAQNREILAKMRQELVSKNIIKPLTNL